MKYNSRPVRTTILLGGLGGLAWLMVDPVLGWHWIRPMRHFGLIWLLTALYALLLVRWSRCGLVAVVFPLAVLGLWGWHLPCARSTIVMALVILSWVRSGVCFPGPPGRALMREALVCGGGGILVAALAPYSTLSGAAGIWLFFLVQALFFAIFETGAGASAHRAAGDPFERSRRQAEKILAAY